MTTKNALAPQNLAEHVAAYLEWLRVRRYAATTIVHRQQHLSQFVQWCEERSVVRPSEVTSPMIDAFQRWLFHARRKDGKHLVAATQHNRLIDVRGLFKWLKRQNIILYNPAGEIELPKLGSRLPRGVLNISEVERVLNEPDIKRPLGLRDRAILETLYSTAIRAAEVTHLALHDLDAERGTLLVRRGKWRKDRTVPIAERALRWVEKYVVDVRPDFVCDPGEDTLFLSRLGRPLLSGTISEIVGSYIRAAGISKPGGAHVFRHTVATLMLENGADVRYIQELLGHTALNTTQVYTQVSIRKLQEVHHETHPGHQRELRQVDQASAHEEAKRQLLASLAADGED